MSPSARALLLLLLLPAGAQAYPVDGYAYTGIRRLEYARQVQSGEVPGRRQQPGQYLPMAEVVPRWHSSDGQVLPTVDTELSRRVAELVPATERANYAMAVLDLSDSQHPLYALHNPETQANVGSVGKILVALALFQKLADLYPNDIPGRERVLRDTQITADSFSQHDHHTVPFYDLERKTKVSRSIRVGDRASLWEFLDWMLSASSNSAAGMVQKELLALDHFGQRYPVTAEEEADFFARTSRKELGRIMLETMNDAAVRNGLDPQKIRQGSFFTHGGNQHADTTSSYATPEQLVKFLFRLEAGTLVDSFSSREIKRLLYMTQRRIRYASHPALNDSAVFFKSGSYFQCVDGPRGCRKYKGDKTNRLASVAMIESPAGVDEKNLVSPALAHGAAAGAPMHHYLVAVMSNVLLVNSAVAHQTLAMRIHRLIVALHPVPQAPPLIPESAYPRVPVDDPEAHQPPGPDQ